VRYLQRCFAWTVNALSAHCRVCKGTQFRAIPPETQLERVVLPLIFLCRGRCIVCHKRRYLPIFQRWTAVPNSWR
jgi:hypothetical protein